jgi:hypothetical protein
VKLRLYFDEDSMTHALIMALRARGVDVASALDAGMVERPDEEHLAYATAEGRALYTFNIADFSRLHAAWLGAARSHAGLILCRPAAVHDRRANATSPEADCCPILRGYDQPRGVSERLVVN